MSAITVGNERPEGSGWRYDVRVDARGRRHDFAVTLARSDYDRWSGGRVPPAEVVRAAFRFLLEREPATSILSSFDCSVIRRYFPEVDSELPAML
ncbi:MAG: hypothetical protein AB1689_20130 [Thermodesulfobacteriota bacterium]